MIEAEIEPWQWLRFSSAFRVIGPQSFDDYTVLGLGELGTYAVWDARLEVRPHRLVTAWLRGSNLLDMNYQTRYGYPDRGIAGWLGVRLTVE
jgi:outer membrane cobalamin receptor